MGKRTNTAAWKENEKRWCIAVQKDGQRRYFHSSTPGRTGQREANAKADAWMDEGINPKGARIEEIYPHWLKGIQETTCARNSANVESRWRVWVLPAIGRKRITALTEQDLQNIINKAHAAGRSKKTLQLLAVDLRAFCRYCRRSKLTAFNPEDLKIPAGARLKGKHVLQPADIIRLFNSDTTEWRGKRRPDEFINAYRF